MARAFRELFRNEHEITFLSEKFRRDTPDIEWITALSREGQWTILSGDRRITRNHAEYQAFRNSNLIGVFMAASLCKAPVAKQMERILALWPAILTVSQTVHGGAMFELPQKSVRLRQLKL